MAKAKTVRERLIGKRLIGFDTSARRTPAMVGTVEIKAPRAMVGQTEVRAPAVMVGVTEVRAPSAMVGENPAD